MLTRRHLIAAGAAGAMAGLIGRGRADTIKLTFCSWGGALSDLEKTALLEPFGKTRGFEVVPASPTNYAKLKAMVEVGAAGMGPRQRRRPLHLARRGPARTARHVADPQRQGARRQLGAPKGIFTSTGATVVAWNTKTFPEGAGPKSWKDFWDVKTFPGPRGLYKAFYYNYEAALLAAGTARADIYPVTEDKVKLAMEKIRELKPNIKVWWTAGAQPPQLLSSGELAMSSAWSGRVLAIMKEKAPVDMTYEDGIAWGNAWVVPKGALNGKLAMEAINYAISPEAQARLLDLGIYGPVLGDAAAKGTPEQRKVLVTAPENIKNMLILNEQQAALYSAKYTNDWDRMQLE